MSILEANVVHRLDAAGEYTVRLPLTDPRTAEAISGRIWRHYREGEGFVFAGLIDRARKTPDSMLELSGPTLLGELALSTILPGVTSDHSFTVTASPVTVTDDSSAGTQAWSNPSNAAVSDGAYATATVDNSVSTHWLRATAFGFALPSDAIVSGIKVEIERSQTGDADAIDYAVQLYFVSAASGGRGRIGAFSTSLPRTQQAGWGGGDNVATYGGEGDLWGMALAADDVNSAGFGVGIAATSTTSSALGTTARVDAITMTVYYRYPDTVDLTLDTLFLGTGWARLSSSGKRVGLAYGGDSVLRGTLRALEAAGLHSREIVSESAGLLVRQLQIGAFGVSSGVTLMNGPPDSLILDDPALAYISDLEVMETVAETWNWIVPLGSGDGLAQQTLYEQNRVPNILTNPNAAKDTAEWTTVVVAGVSYVRATERAVMGEASFRITNGHASSTGTWYQDKPVTAGRVYRMEAWAWPVTNAQFVRIAVEWRTASATISTDTVTLPVGAVNQWSRLASANLTAPGTATVARFKMEVGHGDDAFFSPLRFWWEAVDAGLSANVETDVGNPSHDFPVLVWAISDPTSITAYGRRERSFVAKDVAPASQTGPAARMVAANALYDLASTQLRLWKDKQTSYRCSARGLAATVRPGDKIHIRYRGVAQMWDASYTWLDVDEDFYVLERRRRFNVDGSEESELTISDVDRMPQTTNELIIGSLVDTQRNFRTHVQTYPASYSAPAALKMNFRRTYKDILSGTYDTATLGMRTVSIPHGIDMAQNLVGFENAQISVVSDSLSGEGDTVWRYNYLAIDRMDDGSGNLVAKVNVSTVSGAGKLGRIALHILDPQSEEEIDLFIPDNVLTLLRCQARIAPTQAQIVSDGWSMNIDGVLVSANKVAAVVDITPYLLSQDGSVALGVHKLKISAGPSANLAPTTEVAIWVDWLVIVSALLPEL